MTAQRIWTYEEALGHFPVVRDLTRQAVQQVEALFNRVQSRAAMEEHRDATETSYPNILAAWADEVASLGCVVKGMWLVDWDSGDGYYCWKYPEETISHFHSYEDGFAGRIPVA